MLHRDLKPSNVLVRPDGHVFILDFGLVAALEPYGPEDDESRPVLLSPDAWPTATTDVHLVGTVAYIPPELAAGAPPSPVGDWYSVGIMLYEALSGRRPFSGTTREVLLAKQLQDPPALTSLAPDLPADLVALCEGWSTAAPRRDSPGTSSSTPSAVPRPGVRHASGSTREPSSSAGNRPSPRSARRSGRLAPGNP